MNIEFLSRYPEFREFIGTCKNPDGNKINYWLYSPGRGASKLNKFFRENKMGIREVNWVI